MLHIVSTLLDGPRGFNELGRDVGGCNPSTLRDRLARLETAGIVRRARHDDAHGYPRYTLTVAGEGLREVIQAIHVWSLLHLHSAAPQPSSSSERGAPATNGAPAAASAPGVAGGSVS